MPHNIIDNREKKLAGEIGRMLDNSTHAYFAVGYFFLSGFKAIRESMESLTELRLLIGSTSNRETIEAIALSKTQSGVESCLERMQYKTPLELTDELSEVCEELSRVVARQPQTDEDEDYIKQFSRLLQSGKVKIRVYTKGVLHAKAYIADFKEGQYFRGNAIVGSSNLSLSGIRDNTELNVNVPGDENHSRLKEWFNALWEESVEFDSHLMNVLSNSWAISEPTPYELYLKVAYELVKDRLVEDEQLHKPKGTQVPELFDYQIDAVIQARSILNEYGGVFLCDVVGLGKTYIGAALLADIYAREGEKAIVICPPVLKPQWEYVCDLYDLPVKIVSRHNLSEIEEDDNLMKRPIVLIDESHYFRHQYTKSYQTLEQICFKKKVILVTATPYNTAAKDILNQLRLFHPSDTTKIPIDPPVLTKYFRQVEEGTKKLPDLLEHIMVRRTRLHLKEYKSDLASGRLKFPKRATPVRIDYSIDEVYPGIYDKIEKLLTKLTFARYNIYGYLEPEHREDPDLSQLKEAGKNLVMLMKTMLFKRMESSVEALRQSVKTQAEIHQLFKEQLGYGYVPAGLLAEELNRYHQTGDEDRFEAIIERSAEKYSSNKFKIDRLEEDIESDRKIYTEIYELIKGLKPENDAKLKQILHKLKSKGLRDKKVLIFSEFATTVNYIGGQLQKHYSKAAYVSGGSKDIIQTVKRFAPKSTRAKVTSTEELNILVTTDILAEGLNLQDCNIVISYDLHWNPVRLIQRIGRVDRVSTEFDSIHTFNFFPERTLEARLGLEEKLTRRFKEIHKHLGLDSKYLSSAEQLSDVKLFKRLYTNDPEILLEQEDTSEISFIELIKLLRDLQKDNNELFLKISKMPDKVRSAQYSSTQGTIVFCKYKEFSALYKTDNTGTIISQDQFEILKQLKCKPNTKRAYLPSGFNAQVRDVEARFQDDARERLAQRDSIVQEPIVRQTLKKLIVIGKYLSGSNKKDVEDMKKRLSEPLSRAVKSDLRNIQKRIDTSDVIFQELKKVLLAPTLFDDIKPKSCVIAEPIVVQVVASEALVEALTT